MSPTLKNTPGWRVYRAPKRYLVPSGVHQARNKTLCSCSKLALLHVFINFLDITAP